MNDKSELQKSMFGSTLWNIWIWLSIVLVVLADVNVVVSLGIEGVSGWHLAIPIVFLALDVVLAFVAAFSNFRFRYSLVFPIIYAAFTVVIGIAGIVVYCAVLDYIVFTSFALISWMIFELLSVATILLATIRASGKGLVFSIVTVVLVAVFAAYSVFYVVIVARDGFFGQGKSGSYSSEERTITYKYDEDNDWYIASGTLSGRGGTVVISDSVNGKKVGEVDCSIFLGDGITCARLLCDGDVKFSNTECIASLPDDFAVTASSDDIDDFKTYFYELSVETAKEVATYDARTDALCDAYADFANRMTPEVESGEVYIVFTYSYGDLQTIGVGNVLPTWISERGDAFNVSRLLDGVEDRYMYENMDPSKEANLYYYYTNYDKIILNELRDGDGKAIEGQSITSSTSVGVSYENIYAVSISTNDAVYAETREFISLSDYANGLRYVTGSSANSLISDINEIANARAGFTYKWTYNGETLGSLESKIEDGIEITLEWTLDAPTISMASFESAVYGDDVTLSAEVSHGDEKIAYTYSWDFDGVIGTDETLSLSRVEPAKDSGTYTLTVYASATDTSLTSFASRSITLTVSKKTLSFEWTLDDKSVNELTSEDLTYSGLSKILTATPTSSDIVSGDSVTYEQSIHSVKNAGTYGYSVSLSDSWGDYYALDSSASSSLVVSPYELAVTWGSDEFVFDKQSHVISYSYTLMTLGDDAISDDLLGASADASAKVDAGTYTAEIIWTNGNYIISEPTHSYTISPAELTDLVWTSESLTYNGDYQHPDVYSFTGRVEGDYDEIAFSYEYDGRNAGTGYTVTATSLNSNYVIAEGGDSHLYAITAYELAVTWGTETITYNGSEQILSHEYALASLGTDTISDTLLGVTISGYGTNAGTNAYTATIEWTNTNYALTNTSRTYSIAQREVSVATWSGDALTYNGKTQNPVATSFNNLVSGDNLNPTYTISGVDSTGKNVGSYTVAISINNSNYSLIGQTTHDYEITACSLAVVWGSEELTYNGSEQVISHSFAIDSLGEDTIDDTLLGVSVAGNTDAGDYTATIEWTNINYTLTNTTYGYAISPAELTVTWSETSLEYKGEAQHPEIVSYSELFGYDSISFSYTAGNTNVGDYSVTATSDNGNYTITNPDCPYTISAYTLAIIWDTGTLTYNGSAQAPSHSFSTASLGGDSIDDDLLGVTVSGKQTAAGSDYTATITWTNKNYELANTEKTYSIGRKDVSVVTWDTVTFVYNGEDQHPVAETYDGLVEGEDESVLGATYVVTGGDGINVGTYTVTIFINNSNYNLTETISQSYTITTAPLTVTGWTLTTLFYTGSEQYPTAIFSTVYASDDVEASYTISDGDGINAGTYTVTITAIGNSNYSMPLSDLSTEYTIIALEVSAVWGETSFDYDGLAHEVTCTVIGLNGSALDVLVSIVGDNDATEAKDAGTYTATVSILDTTTAANYAILNPTQTITVAKATVSVTWTDGTPSFTWSGGSIDADAAGITCKYYIYFDANWYETDSIEAEGTYCAVLTISSDNYEFATSAYIAHVFAV